MYHIFIVSDGTGGTAERALKAALVQFANMKVNFVRRPNVRTEEMVREVIREAVKVGGFIVHTLVSDELRKVMVRTGRHYNIETIDLLGPLLARLSQTFGSSPSEKPGLFRHLTEGYFRRIETMEFAFRHDDGQRISHLEKAEIVLIGVSRTFKTPLSIYLAFKCWFVANVPIVLDVPPPPILFEIPPERVFCLTTEPGRLAILRRARQDQWDWATGDYADPRYVRREITYAHRIFRKQPSWSVIDVTNKPIEEIASEVLALVKTTLEAV